MNDEKTIEQEIGVTTWNVNKSSAPYVFLLLHGWMSSQCSDISGDPKMATRWHGGRIGMDLAWRKGRMERQRLLWKKQENSNLLKYCRRSTRWILVVVGSILFLSMYLPHIWCVEENLEEYYKTLRHLDKNMQEVKQKSQIFGILPEWRQGPFVGEVNFDTLLMEWITKHEVKLANTFWQKLRTYKGHNKKNWFLEAEWATIAEVEDDWLYCGAHLVGNEKHSGKKLQSSKPYTSLASDDTCKNTTQERKLEVWEQFYFERMEAKNRK